MIVVRTNLTMTFGCRVQPEGWQPLPVDSDFNDSEELYNGAFYRTLRSLAVTVFLSSCYLYTFTMLTFPSTVQPVHFFLLFLVQLRIARRSHAYSLTFPIPS